MEENHSDKENRNVQIEEHSTYSLNNNILYKERANNQTKHSFNYTIIKEGVYPNGALAGPLKNRQENSQDSATYNVRKKRPVQQYKIPHGYIVETTWGRALKKKTVRCEINYINEIPHFRIKYGSDFQFVVSSTKSPSDATSNYEKVCVF